MKRAIVFPGQGSQIVGMGKDFYDAFLIAKHTFQEVDDALEINLSRIIFNGPEQELTSTINAQPALMAVSIAILRVIKEQTNKDITKLCSYIAGHSLGEYSALCAAESISLHDTAKLLKIRGASMQQACKPGEGAMAACIGIGMNKLEEIIKNVINEGVCEIANDNIEGQIIISGNTFNVERIIAILKDLNYKAIILKVSAPFHCSLMKPAEEKMTKALEEVLINPPHVPLVTNVTADVTADKEQIKQNLISQVCGRVRWRETLEKFNSLNVPEIVEIGSGKVLTGLLKKTSYNFVGRNISSIAEMEEIIGNI